MTLLRTITGYKASSENVGAWRKRGSICVSSFDTQYNRLLDNFNNQDSGN